MMRRLRRQLSRSPEKLYYWNRVTDASILVKTEDGRVVTEVPLNPLVS
jgi:hypothetical protein